MDLAGGVFGSYDPTVTQTAPHPVAPAGASKSYPLIPDAPAAAIAPEGMPIVLVFLAVGLGATAGALMWNPIAGYAVGALTLVLNVWCLWFFRDPARRIPGDPAAVVSPANGRVVAVDRMPPPAEVEVSPEFRATCLRISIFMNVFDVHVNRAPVRGKVVRVKHQVGKFLNAALQKAAEENERCSLVMRTEDGREVVAVQIAGLVARRIVCRVGDGRDLEKGERYGLIRFGSRVDVFVPAGTEPGVKIGDKTVSGESVIARLARLGG